MRKAVIIVAAAVGVVVIAVLAVLFYAATNLNSIIAENRQKILTRASDTLGREVSVKDITASLGWGVMADLKGVTVADDPAISSKPMIEASDVYARVELMPLLSKTVHITDVVLKSPDIRIIRTRDGKLNVASIGAKSGKEKEAEAGGKRKRGAHGELTEEAGGEAAKGPTMLAALLVKNFSIQDGTVSYTDEQAGGPPLKLSSIDVDVTDFNFGRPFDAKLSLAALGTDKNLDVDAKVGPLMKGGALDVDAIPLDLTVKVGPLKLSDAQAIPAAARAIPAKLSLSNAVNLDAKASGTVNAIDFSASTDLSSNQIAFGDSFTKPSGLTLKVSANGSRTDGAVAINTAHVVLGDVDLRASKIRFGGGTTSARIDTNRFALAPLAQVLPTLAKFNLAGKAEIHSAVQMAGSTPTANGVVTLDQVALSQPGAKNQIVSALSGNVNLAGKGADVGPLKFNLGSSPSELAVHADSLMPVRAGYSFSSETVKLSELVPSRPADEQINKLTASGTVVQTPDGMTVGAKVGSAAGSVANVAYNNLALDAMLRGKQAAIKSLRIGAFGGAIAAAGSADLSPNGPFDIAANISNVDIQQALQSQQSKSANMIRGTLTGSATVAGRTGTFDQMKPTFNGNGKIAVTNAKLVGVNVAAEGLKKVDNLPMIGTLIPQSVVQNHPELFNNPDTDIKSATLTFALQGPRITTHDLLVQTVDYNLTGDGWFDMDKNIDLTAHLLLSKPLTNEIVAQKQQVLYVANRDGQVDIPVRVTGQLPKPRVTPDVTYLAQQASQRAVQEQGQKYVGKLLGKKGGAAGGLLGGFLGGGSSGGAGSGGAAATPGSAPTQAVPNPADLLKKLF
jgi:uncharacterized protein involved in outer membrane biogenesis